MTVVSARETAGTQAATVTTATSTIQCRIRIRTPIILAELPALGRGLDHSASADLSTGPEGRSRAVHAYHVSGGADHFSYFGNPPPYYSGAALVIVLYWPQ